MVQTTIPSGELTEGIRSDSHMPLEIFDEMRIIPKVEPARNFPQIHVGIAQQALGFTKYMCPANTAVADCPVVLRHMAFKF